MPCRNQRGHAIPVVDLAYSCPAGRGGRNTGEVLRGAHAKIHTDETGHPYAEASVSSTGRRIGHRKLSLQP
jgi:hypothetical protein